MHDFQLYSPTRIFFGESLASDFFTAAAGIGKKVLLTTGGSSAERLGYRARVQAGLTDAGITIVHFPGIEANPHAATIDKAAEIGRQEKVDAVVALGGGSTMDASKAIAALIHNGEPHIWPYVTGQPKAGQLAAAIPVMAVPTTAATASEVTPYAVISDPPTNGKSVIGHDCLRPTLSWLNPAFTLELPATVTADGASDILSHVFENYLVGDDASPLADAHSEGVMQTVVRQLPLLRKDLRNLELRAQFLWASDIALNGYQSAGRKPGAFVLHAMEHALSGFKPELAHGRGLATLYPAYFRFLYANNRNRHRIARMGRTVFGVTNPDDDTASLECIDRLIEWLKANGLHQSLADLGFEEAQFKPIAEYTVATYGDGHQLDACGPLDAAQIEEIFRQTSH